MENKKKIMYIGILLIITVIVSITYFSYAFLTQTDVQHGKMNIVVGTLEYQLKIDNQEVNTVIVPANDTKEVEVKVKSLNTISSKFELYYLNIENVEVGYTEDNSEPTGTLDENEEVTITLILTNNTSSNKEVTLGVQGSLINNDIELASNMNSIEVADTAELCNIPVGTTYDFDYTGDVQTFTPACKGKYKIELWGAQGTDTIISVSQSSYKAFGGKGAYTSGRISLDNNTPLYIYVGKEGTANSAAYNGGGQAINGARNINVGGGGATDIRYFDGNTITNSDLDWDSMLGLNSRIMVAAGGGGATNYTASASSTTATWEQASGGDGGGLDGYQGDYSINGNRVITLSYSMGGTQVSGGAGATSTSSDARPGGSGLFGIGGSALNGDTTAWGGAGSGGGGYYGGGGGGLVSGILESGAGGSSFISGYSGCNAISESSTENNIIHTNQEIHYSGKTFTEGVMIDGKGCNWSTGSAANCGANQPQPDGTNTTGHSGDGYARITYLGNGGTAIGTSWIFDYTGNIQEFNTPKDGAYKLETWGAQGGGDSTYIGGYGAYSTGITNLNKNDVLYLAVGEAGKWSTIDYEVLPATYNGGGTADSWWSSADVTEYHGSGGGATHIAKVSGTLSSIGYTSFVTNNNGYMVAAGGGGAGYFVYTSSNYVVMQGGNGGGINGNIGDSTPYGSFVSAINSQPNTPATQMSPSTLYYNGGTPRSGSFGQAGGNYIGGGSGLYGGAGTAGRSSGGSSYIGNSSLVDKKMVCYNCTTSTAVNTYTESNTCVNATATSNCSKIGNGYAKITYLGYRINLDSNGGNIASSTIYTIGTLGELPTPTKTGYVFTGWVDDNNNTVNENTSVRDIPNYNLTATYRPITYKVRFNANGGTGNMPDETFTYDQAKALSSNGFSRSGKTFVGWSTASGNQLLYYSATEITGTNEFMQYTDISPYFNAYGSVTYTISADVKSANTSKENRMSIYCQNGSTARWSFQKGFTVTTSYQNFVFRDIVPTLYNANETKTMLAFYGVYSTGNKPSAKNIYLFLGNYYKNTENISNLTATDNGVINLYAVWR